MSRPVLSSSRPSNHPSPSPSPSTRLCLWLGLRLQLNQVHGRRWGRRAGTHQGEIAPHGRRATGVIHVCKWRGISRRTVQVYAHMCACVCLCTRRMHSPYFISAYPATGGRRKKKTGGSAVRRRAEKRGSHNKAPRGSLCMQHSSGETRTFGASVTVLGRTTWMPGQPCQSSSPETWYYSHSSRARIAYPVSCAPSGQHQAVPAVPRSLGKAHCDRVSSIVRLIKPLGQIGPRWRAQLPDGTRRRSSRRSSSSSSSSSTSTTPRTRGMSTSPGSQIS